MVLRVMVVMMMLGVMVGCDDDVGGDDGVDDGKEGSCGVVLDRLDNQAGKTRAST